MGSATENPIETLSEWLRARPQDFSGEDVVGLIHWLLNRAAATRSVEARYLRHRAAWARLPDDVRLLASRRQVAALAARLAMRAGMDSDEAAKWTISIAGMSSKEAQRACASALHHGDRLFVWQWRELRALGLRQDFLSRRALERWIERDEDWLFDARWFFPLHLVDAEVLAQYGIEPPAVGKEADDVAE